VAPEARVPRSGRRVPSVEGGQSRNSGLSDRDVLFDRPGASSDSAAVDAAVETDGDASAEDDNLAGAALIDAEQRLAGSSQVCQLCGRLVEDPRRQRLVDGKIDTADKRAIVAHERQ
jgi:hypothetical protein